MKTVTGRFKSANPNIMESEKNSVVQMQNVKDVWIETDFNRHLGQIISQLQKEGKIVVSSLTVR